MVAVIFLMRADILQVSDYSHLSLQDRRAIEVARGIIPVRCPRPGASQAISQQQNIDQPCKKRKITSPQANQPCKQAQSFTFLDEEVALAVKKPLWQVALSSVCKTQDGKIEYKDGKVQYKEIGRRAQYGLLTIEIDQYKSQGTSLPPEGRKLFNDSFLLEQRVICDDLLTKDELEDSYNVLQAKYQQVASVLSPRARYFIQQSLNSLKISVHTFDQII